MLTNVVESEVGETVIYCVFIRDGDNRNTQFEGKTHGNWEQRECCSAGRGSVGGGGSRPKLWGTCRETPLNWWTPPDGAMWQIIMKPQFILVHNSHNSLKYALDNVVFVITYEKTMNLPKELLKLWMCKTITYQNFTLMSHIMMQKYRL